MNFRDCACRIVEKRRGGRPLVVLTSPDYLPSIRNRVAVTLPLGSKCNGASWVDPSGSIVSVKSYRDKVPSYPNGFDLEICNEGATYTPEDLKNLKRWRSAFKNG